MILSIESSCDDSAIAITDIKTKKLTHENQTAHPGTAAAIINLAPDS